MIRFHQYKLNYRHKKFRKMVFSYTAVSLSIIYRWRSSTTYVITFFLIFNIHIDVLISLFSIASNPCLSII